jgi:NTE family protein
MKLGLALSGGGFRAALFHVGVLARMAEFDLLRHVEVISTVSGGSIVGAFYYVKLKRLLEQTRDAEVSHEDYVRLVEAVEKEFVAAVQKNIRMRTFLNPLKNIKMTGARYSRSDRMGELFDRLLYRSAVDPARERMVEMRELKISPPDGTANFSPRTDNAARRAKVPILLINATTLHTGHNWRFEASTMGPPPRASATAADVDKNWRLLRARSYDDITPVQQNVELGLAVAASACVPGIFPPLALSGLYPGIRVELADGGVHDNQGIQGLLDEQCTHLVVSDASGQLDDLADPATRMWAVASRANDILMDRVREEQLFDLLDRRGLPTAFVHLRRGMPVEAVPWIDRDGKPATPVAAGGAPPILSSGFGVDPRVQDLLSRVRTDLDSFTDIEAYSLMLDGYLMSQPALRTAAGITNHISQDPSPPNGQWGFLAVRQWVGQPTEPYLKRLRVAGETLFKVFRLSPATAVITAALSLAIIWLLWRWQAPSIAGWWNTTVTIGQLVIAGLLLVVGLIPWLSGFLKWLRFLRSPTEWVLRLVIRGLVPAVGALFVWIHLQVFDRLFLWLGRVERLGTEETRAAGPGKV